MSMEPKVIAWARCTVAGGVISAFKAYNCQVGRQAAGIFNIVLGYGADVLVTQPAVSIETPAAAGAGTARAFSITQSSDTAKILTIFDDANAAADPAGFYIEFRRFPPIPAP